ncbi:MAG TPA: hypothetical protein DCS82_04475 [Rhodospirillaceae bacterium]|nr:hypothetical protein [Rhodospirillaceae bacterium]HAT34949.1 hypothetical protein [Rhodospirillaceae bacterium]|tara:strand:+ start:73 stop:546 length:474 start_codon:yes stop_codon:yes gene_type:complete
MKVYLTHHADALSAEEDPVRHLSEQGVAESERLGKFMKATGSVPARVLHSDKQWTKETGERVAAELGISDKTAVADYGIAPEDPVEPFIAEIEADGGDILMAGHGDFLIRVGSKLLTGDENNWVIEFRPGNGTTFCLEKADDGWKVAWAWRQNQLAA